MCRRFVLFAFFACSALFFAKRQLAHYWTDVILYDDGACPRGWRTASRSARVFDVVAVNMEMDLLEARLLELDGVVDGFVIVEEPYMFI